MKSKKLYKISILDLKVSYRDIKHMNKLIQICKDN